MREGKRLDAELAGLRHETIRGRDWRRVRILGMIAATLLMGSLVLDPLMGVPELAWIPFSGGIAIGAAMFVYAFNRRLFLIKPPVE